MALCPPPPPGTGLAPAGCSGPSGAPHPPPPDCTQANGPAKCCSRSLDSAFERGTPPSLHTITLMSKSLGDEFFQSNFRTPDFFH